MKRDFYKERNKRIFKIFVSLFVVLGTIAILFFVAFHGSDRDEGLLLTFAGILMGYLSIVIFIKARLNQVGADYKPVAVVAFIAGLVNIYIGIHQVLRSLGEGM